VVCIIRYCCPSCGYLTQYLSTGQLFSALSEKHACSFIVSHGRHVNFVDLRYGTCCIAFLDGVCDTMLLNLLRSHKDLKKGRDIPIIYTAASVVMPRVVNYGVISSVSSNVPCVQCP